MITIYDKLEKDFNHNGICILNNCISAEVEEQLNGIYKLELECPIDNHIPERNKWLNIVEGNIIKASTPQGNQLFRIFKKKKNLNSISCVCFHIFYDLIDNFIEDRRPTNATGTSAIVDLFKGTQYPHSFNVNSDISKVNTSYYIRKNPIEALLSDDENSFLNRWGGEIVRDNFSISMKAHRGEDRGVTIRYGKNLIGLEEEIDESNVITRIMPTGLYENDTVLMLPEKYIDSPLINKYVHPKIKHIHFTELKVNKEENITEAMVQKALRDKVKELYEIQKVDLPIVNYKVDFIELSKTEEYKDYQILERVWLGDIITVKHNRLGVDLKSKVISYKWDSISNRYIGLELGNFIKNIADSMSEQDKKINQAAESFQKALSETAKVIQENQDSMDATIEEVTKTMNNALGGHVLKRNDELLIMDTDNPLTCTKCWKFNMNGLGYSKNGYYGLYETAITMDGTIVGKFLKGETIQGVSLQGAEMVTVDNPVWDSWDITEKSNNISKMVKGELIFQSRNNYTDSWYGDKATEVKMNGWGLSMEQRGLTKFLNKKFGGKDTRYQAGMIEGTSGHNDAQGFSITGFPRIYLDTQKLHCNINTPIYAEHFLATERLGKIINGLTGTTNTLFYLMPTNWEYINLMNSWYNYDASSSSYASWCLTSSGCLQLRGRVNGGGQGTVIGKIPLQAGLGNKSPVIHFPVICEKGIGRVEVDRAGNIICRINPGGWVALDNISFRVDIPIEIDS